MLLLMEVMEVYHMPLKPLIVTLKLIVEFSQDNMQDNHKPMHHKPMDHKPMVNKSKMFNP
jgi:hypothetical protein